MAGLRVWFCLILILVSVTCSEARPLESFPNKRKQALIKTATEIIRVSMRKHQLEIGEFDMPNRVSPGGPDPKHH